MSEKPKEKPWQDEIKEIVRQSLQEETTVKMLAAEMVKQKQALASPPFSEKAPLASPPFSEKAHKTAQEIADCPECRKEYKVDEYNKKVEAEATEKFLKEHPYYCTGEGCGTYLTEKEATEGSECPHCHGTAARKRT